MKLTPAVALLLASSSTKAINMKQQKPTKNLAQRDNHGHALNKLPVKKELANPQASKSLLQTQEILTSGGLEVNGANYDAGYLPYKPIPANYDMGPNPDWLILLDKWNDPVPEGYYLPDQSFVEANRQALQAYGDAHIGEWSIIAFYGGQMTGSGHGYKIECKDGCVDDPLYDVYYNDAVSDVLLVAADPEHPGCDIEGYDCTCVKKPAVDPFTRKPLPCDSGYTAYTRHQVEEWDAYKASLGFDSVSGWSMSPASYFSSHIYLDYWNLFGGEDWEEWRFGQEIVDKSGNVVDWPVVAGIAFMNNDGAVVYEYIVEIPDMPEVMPGEKYDFKLYNQNSAGNQCSSSPDASWVYGLELTIGEPWGCYECKEHEMDIIKAIWEFADFDNDNCVTKNEMISLFEWASQDEDAYVAMVDSYFGSGDADADGFMTWKEINDWLATVEYDAYGQKMEQAEKDAMKSFFKYFDGATGDADDMLTRDEAIAGTLALAEKIGYFYHEYNYYMQFFDENDDECIMLNELEKKIDDAYDVTEPEINYYWIKYYWELYSITEYYWWIYRLPNGGFDFDGYYNHVPDGPAFDGASWLYFDETIGYTQTVYMWYLDSFCYFSLNVVGNSDPSASGECTIEGHKNIGSLGEGSWDTDELIFYFGANPTHAVKFNHQVEEWGPVEYMTEDRYYSEEGIWMWQKPDQYCDVCDDVPDWSVITFNVQSTDFTYGYDTETIGYNDDAEDGGLYQTGEGYKNEDEFALAGVDEDGNMIVAPDVYPDGVIDDTMYGIDEDGNMIVAPDMDYYSDYYMESFSYSTSVYYESFSYSEVYYDEFMDSFSYSEVYYEGELPEGFFEDMEMVEPTVE